MNGLSTLNRLLGKRNKDVSKSTSNLSRSTTNLDTSSQYNKIVPLAAMTNAPFEQTFRITVLLPRDQLYVARIGAKTRLAALMDMICTDKQLDAQKYLFRHPSDFHQGFELDLTIGEVGLNEIRLVSKKELENLQNNEYRLSTSDIFRLHQKNIRESSVSSSDLSRTSRVALKTTSPYSSTNSLNSMDSSGLSSSSRGGINGNQHHPPVAPTRKKRVAPRPPSQNSIPEKGPLETPKADPIFKEPQLPPYSKKNFHVSSPNLFNRDLKAVDVANNNEYNGTPDSNGNGHHVETVEEMHNIINTKTSFSTLKNRPTSMYIIREPPENHNGNGDLTNTNSGGGSMLDIVNHSRTSSNSSDVKDPRDFQEQQQQRPETPSRKRLDSNAKKAKPPAPAPPPRGVSLGTLKPQPAAAAEPKIVPTPSPRAPARSVGVAPGGIRDNETIISETDSNVSEADELQRNKETVSKLNAVNSTHQPAATTATPANVSKVMLNVDQSSAPSSLSPEVDRKPPTNGASSVSIKIVKEEQPPVTNGHHEQPLKPVTPIQVSKVHIVPSVEQDVSVDESVESIDRRLSNGNSSDEDIKIYNIESGKEMRIPEKKDETVRSPSPEEEEQWTYTLPAPPKFADSSIKSGEYDEKQRYFELQSTFVDNTTFVTDRVTVHSDETEQIRPIIREKVLLDESLGEIEPVKCASPTETLGESEAGSSPGEVLINSDIEDGYRGGSELRESMIQTLEKRREKLKESELQELKESIEGGAIRQEDAPEEPEVPNESDIMKCAKLNEETVVDDYTVIVRRSSAVTRSQSVIETRKNSGGGEKPVVQKSDVINELAQVISEENGLKGVLNGKKVEEDGDIAGVNPNNLSNFKISTYNGMSKDILEPAPVEEKPVSAPTSQKSDSEEEHVIVRRKISADSMLRTKLSSEDEDDPRAPYQSSAKKDHPGGPVKRRSLTVLNNKSPKNINRSDSFHSTRSDYIQSLASSNGLRLTPRSTSYISLIGAQKFENRFAPANRRKSTSEVSICDAPSLQSLQVIKHILNTSRSNLAAAAHGDKKEEEEEVEQEVLPMAAIKRNSFTDISTLVQFKSEVVRSGLTRRESLVERKIEEVEVVKKVDEEEEEVLVSTKVSEKLESLEPVFDVSNESKSDDEKLQNKQLTATVTKQPQTTVVNITTTSTTVAHSGVTVNGESGSLNEKKWKYQGPPTINLTTWSERPKIDVSIKSDRDYRFGGSSTLPRGYRNVNNTTKININAPSAPASERDDGHDCPDSREQVPLSNGEAQAFSLPQEVNRPEPVSFTSTTTDRLPIVRAVEYKKNIVPPPAVAQKPEKSYFYETFSRTAAQPSGTATINRLSMGYQKFQPVVRGFKSMDDKEPSPRQRPVSMIESSNISTAILRSTPVRVEKPAPETSTASLPFGQNTLRRTGLKDKILAQAAPEPAKPAIIVPLKATPVVAAAAAPPPPPPVAPKMTTPVVRAAIVKRPLPPAQVDPRSALLDAIRGFNKEKLRKEAGEQAI
uniref:WH2 domain-containing protein n=1 Tax=Culex tarsalis TaxID=7177 RepID=A0A1Q3G4L6_CULTA